MIAERDSAMRAAPASVKRLLRSALAALLLASATPAAMAIDVTHVRVANIGVNQSINIGLNKSVIIDLPVDAAEVIVSQPAVANAILRNKRRAIIQSTGGGETNIFFLDAAGRTIVVFDVAVKGQSSTVAAALRDTYRRVLPNSNIQVESVQLIGTNGEPINRIVLSGTAPSGDDVAKAVSIAGQFAGSADNVSSVINVGGPQQVQLKVTVAEVQREVVKQLGIDLSGSFSAGGITTSFLSDQALGGSSNVATTNGATIGYKGGGLTLEATLKSLERHGALRTLAEPTLTTMSGQEAEFLAGGDYPVPTDVADNKITYTFKPFGVNLKFTPTIKSDGTIGLTIDTSVSEPTTEGSYSVGDITIPATKNRQTKTTVELGAGQTLAIGGLMQDKVRTQINRLPGLGDIPILGTLFRSRDFIRSQTELVVLVTPTYAVAGLRPETPVDKMLFTNDAEANFLGHIENVYGVGPNGTRGSYSGSVGFLLD